jgi:hypothetical protein
VLPVPNIAASVNAAPIGEAKSRVVPSARFASRRYRALRLGGAIVQGVC